MIDDALKISGGIGLFFSFSEVQFFKILSKLEVLVFMNSSDNYKHRNICNQKL